MVAKGNVLEPRNDAHVTKAGMESPVKLNCAQIIVLETEIARQELSANATANQDGMARIVLAVTTA